jgi:hypothetical protein
VAALSVNATEGKVLPGANRVFTATWSDGFPVYTDKLDPAGQVIKNAKGEPQKQLKWNFSQVSHLRFGHYTAELVLIYNDGQRDIPVTGTLSFWVIPWRLVGGMLVIFVFMLIGFWSSFKKMARFMPKKKKDRKKSNEK